MLISQKSDRNFDFFTDFRGEQGCSQRSYRCRCRLHDELGEDVAPVCRQTWPANDPRGPSDPCIILSSRLTSDLPSRRSSYTRCLRMVPWRSRNLSDTSRKMSSATAIRLQNSKRSFRKHTGRWKSDLSTMPSLQTGMLSWRTSSLAWFTWNSLTPLFQRRLGRRFGYRYAGLQGNGSRSRVGHYCRRNPNALILGQETKWCRGGRVSQTPLYLFLFFADV